ncbi:MAG: FAD-dependent oxidoreductase [Armatimonadota bacterium]
MPVLTIDGISVQVAAGSTILDAATAVGIKIPTMCFLKGLPAQTSCLVCVVRVNGSPRLVPSCATVAVDGMMVDSSSEDVLTARRTALELLLGNHLGDCVGPCQTACPAHMDIPTMIAQIAAGEYRQAITTIKQHIALPAVVGRICPELCERSCHRATHDSPLSICRLKRFAADIDLTSPQPYLPDCAPPSGKRVAIIGAGPTGLAAAYYLQQMGHHCVLFDEHEQPGGMLRYGVTPDRLPHGVLDAEIGLILQMGAELRTICCCHDAQSLDDLSNQYDAVLLACGKQSSDKLSSLGLKTTSHGLLADRQTMMSSKPGVFAAGSVVTPSQYAVRAVAKGRSAAISIDHYLKGSESDADHAPFSVHMGHLQEGEIAIMMEDTSASRRVAPQGDGFTEDEAVTEASRCMRCECGKLHGCKLRDYSIELKASPTRFKGARELLRRYQHHPYVVYEPGKCITCGICIELCQKSAEPIGLAFMGRGFDVKPGIPFNEPFAQALKAVAVECVKACPTGALVMKKTACLSAPEEIQHEPI